jgi:hypothetical protein
MGNRMKMEFVDGVCSWRVLPDEPRNIHHVLQHFEDSFVAKLPLKIELKV